MTRATLSRSGPRHVIQLSGSLSPGWAGNLAAGLAARRINMVRARARRLQSFDWEVEVEVDLLDPDLDLTRIDFVALTVEERAARPAERGEITLESFQVSLLPDGLEVEMRAQDALGFLDGFLRVFSFFGLFPQEMLLEKQGTEVSGRLLFQSFAGGAPPRNVARAVERRLEALVTR